MRFGLGGSISGAPLIRQNDALTDSYGRLCGCMVIVISWTNWSFSMYSTFVALAYLRDARKPPIEVGYAPSYKDAADLIKRWAAIRSHTENISYFRVEERYYV